MLLFHTWVSFTILNLSFGGVMLVWGLFGLFLFKSDIMWMNIARMLCGIGIVVDRI